MADKEVKKRILTGDRPTGKLHIGHYFGSLQNRVKLQNEYETFIEVADVQALTDNFANPDKVKKNVKEIVMDQLAVGIDPNKATFFLQSMIPEIAELTVFYSNLVTIARLERNPTVKTEIAQKREIFGESVTYGFLGYPVSQAADITAFEGTIIPVGEDQRQHLELTRDVAQRFNNTYNKEIFKIPEPFIPKETGRIMSLQDPTKKMSKSDSNKDGFISLLDPRDEIVRKVKKAVTDSENVIRYSDDKPGIKNLMNIYSAITDKNYNEIEAEFKDSGYGQFKLAVANAIADTLEPIQAKFNELNAPENNDYLNNILAKGAKEASEIASKKITAVKEAVGFLGK